MGGEEGKELTQRERGTEQGVSDMQNICETRDEQELTVR